MISITYIRITYTLFGSEVMLVQNKFTTKHKQVSQKVTYLMQNRIQYSELIILGQK